MSDRISTITAILIIIFIAMALFSGVFGYWKYMSLKSAVVDPQVQQNQVQNNSEATTWNTYRNDEYGFEFQYPLSSTIVPAYPNNKVALLDLGVSKNTNGADFYPVWIYVADKSDEGMINKIDPLFQFGTKGTISMNNAQWTTSYAESIPTNGQGMAGSDYVVSLQKGDHNFLLRCINCNEKIFGEVGSGDKLLFDQIFSSFKFTK